jgi:hypothetical protein
MRYDPSQVRRLGRILLNALTVLSLLLFVATVVLWVRGYFYWRFEGVTFNSGATVEARQFHYCVLSRPFGLSISHHRLWTASLRPGWLPFSTRAAPGNRAQYDEWYRANGGQGIAGVWLIAGVPSGDRRIYEIMLPHWVVALITATMPALWLRKHLKERGRTDPGHCRSCGYDLRATPERCPECGTIPAR